MWLKSEVKQHYSEKGSKDKNQERNVLCDYYNILTQNGVTLEAIMLRTKVMCRYSFHKKNILEQSQSLVISRNRREKKTQKKYKTKNPKKNKLQTQFMIIFQPYLKIMKEKMNLYYEVKSKKMKPMKVINIEH